MTAIRKLTRREFLQVTGAGGAGLWLAAQLPARAAAAKKANGTSEKPQDGGFKKF